MDDFYDCECPGRTHPIEYDDEYEDLRLVLGWDVFIRRKDCPTKPYPSLPRSDEHLVAESDHLYVIEKV